MIKIERNPIPPSSLEIEKAKAQGSFRKDDVINQLNSDFHAKCYLCEIDELQSVEVEHLRPHHGDKDLMFCWNNLFLSCPHCNSVKNKAKYDNVIIDCCNTDPEAQLDQNLEESHVKVTPLKKTCEAIQTAELLTECFEQKNTGIRTLECYVRIEQLKMTMNLLYKTLDTYSNDYDAKSLPVLRHMLSRTYKFSGFTRTYVRKNNDKYPALAQLVAITE